MVARSRRGARAPNDERRRRVRPGPLPPDPRDPRRAKPRGSAAVAEVQAESVRLGRDVQLLANFVHELDDVWLGSGNRPGAVIPPSWFKFGEFRQNLASDKKFRQNLTSEQKSKQNLAKI